MLKKGLRIFIFSGFLFIIFSFANSALADLQACTCVDLTKATTPTCADCTALCSGNNHQGTKGCVPVANLPGTNSGNGSATYVSLTNPLGSAIDSPQILMGKIINSVLGIVGSIALIMFIFGGFTWMTSGGSAEKIKKGRDIIVWSAIGLAIIFASYGLVRFLLSAIK